MSTKIGTRKIQKNGSYKLLFYFKNECKVAMGIMILDSCPCLYKTLVVLIKKLGLYLNAGNLGQKTVEKIFLEQNFEVV